MQLVLNGFALLSLLEELERSIPSPEELKWAGLHDAFLIRTAKEVLRAPEVARVKILRARWQQNYKRLPQHAKKLAEPSNEEVAFYDTVQQLSVWLSRIDARNMDKEVTIPVAMAYVQNGF